ncbi:MAG: CDGSH iron-sulfur domain-containing protein [Vampirovibrionales bacterium]
MTRPEPRSVLTEPATVTLEKGYYSWCSCGYSKDEPFCDGKHIGKGFCPMTLIISEEQETLTLCQCKRTQTPPYCDGSHGRTHSSI